MNNEEDYNSYNQSKTWEGVLFVLLGLRAYAVSKKHKGKRLLFA